jgi:hypothetical protein
MAKISTSLGSFEVLEVMTLPMISVYFELKRLAFLQQQKFLCKTLEHQEQLEDSLPFLLLIYWSFPKAFSSYQEDPMRSISGRLRLKAYRE